MKILLCSVPFHPQVGGIESVSMMLAEHFHAMGHEVVVLTRTPSDSEDACAWRVVRQPGAVALLTWVRWAEVVLHNNISLRMAWPLLLWGKPWVVAHHTWLPDGSHGGPAASLKRLAMRAASNIAVSRALAHSLPVTCTVIPNPYDDRVFREAPGAMRTRELICVGRLVSEKGQSVLLRALALLRARGCQPMLTLAGQGPDEPELRRLCDALGIAPQVQFAGSLAPEALAAELNQHRILVAPSLRETFGLAALEGLACGCRPIVAQTGGLPEAIGSHGISFAAGDAVQLADCIEKTLNGTSGADDQAGLRQHLHAHRRERVGEAYLQVLIRALRPLRVPLGA